PWYSDREAVASAAASVAIRGSTTSRAVSRPAPRKQDLPQLVLEGHQLRALELPGPAGDRLHRLRVHRPPIPGHLEMEVRAGRKPDRPDITDHLASMDDLAGISGDPAHMPVF